MTSVMQVLNRAARSATKHFVARLDGGRRGRGTPGRIRGIEEEKTQLNVGGSVGGTRFDCFFIAIILVPSPTTAMAISPGHSVPVDLYRVSSQPHISRR